MWRFLAPLFLLAAGPALAQAVTVDLAVLDGMRRARTPIQAAVVSLRDATTVTPLAPLPSVQLVARVRDTRPSAALALLAGPVPDGAGQALLALPMREPPRPVRARTMPIELARFAPHLPSRIAPYATARIEVEAPPVIDAVRLLYAFEPALDPVSPRDPITVREAAVPSLVTTKLLPRSADLQFAAATATLDDADRQALDGLTRLLDRDRARHVRLLVALRPGDDPDAARRMALARMLTVQRYLAAHGIAATRVEARAVVAQQNTESVRIALVD